MNTKEQILKALNELPDDATVEDAMERLYVLYKIERGIAQADAGQTVTQVEARQRMARWLK
jgi:predicted transcriptional regulator